jgi:ferrous iron transport protein B
MNQVSAQTGLEEILQEVDRINPSGVMELNDSIVSNIYGKAEQIAREAVSQKEKPRVDWDRTLDDILTSRVFGFPSMLLLLAAVFWLTVSGANYPSTVLASALFWGQDGLMDL